MKSSDFYFDIVWPFKENYHTIHFHIVEHLCKEWEVSGSYATYTYEQNQKKIKVWKILP